MAHPKRRQSKARTLKRRTHDKPDIGRMPELRRMACISHSMP